MSVRRYEPIIALAATAGICGPNAANAANLTCRSEEGQQPFAVAGYDDRYPVLTAGKRHTPLETLSGGTNPIYQGTNEAGELVTFMLDTTTGRYGFNVMGPDGLTSMDSGQCGGAS